MHPVKTPHKTGDALPVKQALRRQPAPYQEFLDKKIDDMLKNKIIAPATSPWAANVVIVRKKDGSLRFCLDTRPLNRVTVPDQYPLPLLSECLDALSGSSVFSTPDLFSFYWQLELDPQDSNKTALCSRRGLYRFLVVPMGAINSAACAQRTMDLILAGLSFVHTLAYLNDLVVFSNNPSSHIDHLREIFLRFKAANLKFNPKKCRFMIKEIHFLGFRINADGISPDESKTEKIMNWPIPRNDRNQRVRRFSGLLQKIHPQFQPYHSTINPFNTQEPAFHMDPRMSERFRPVEAKTYFFPPF